MRKARKNVGFVVCAVLLGLFVGLIFIVPSITNFDGEAMAIDAILAPPSAQHWLGTDHLGRDNFIRTVLGGRAILALAAAATLLGVGFGAVVGMVAGYKGGWLDEALMRFGDAIMALPSLILAMIVMVAAGSGPFAILLATVIIFTPRAARIARSAVLGVVKSDYIAAASLIGESQTSIIFREILPNIWPNLLVEGCLRFSYAILIVSSLGYLGIGLQPPTPDWGLMISEASSYVTAAPWMLYGPAGAIVLSVFSIHLIGDYLQEWVAQRMRRATSHV